MSETNHIVKHFNIGNTHIHICDDYCKNKSAADIEKILSKIASDAMTALSVVQNKGSTENDKAGNSIIKDK